MEGTGGAKRKPETRDIPSEEGTPKETPSVLYHDHCSEAEAAQASGPPSILVQRKRVYVPRPYKKVVLARALGVRVLIDAVCMLYYSDDSFHEIVKLEIKAER